MVAWPALDEARDLFTSTYIHMVRRTGEYLSLDGDLAEQNKKFGLADAFQVKMAGLKATPFPTSNMELDRTTSNSLEITKC